MQKYLPTHFYPHRQRDSMFLIQTTDVVSELLSKGKRQARMRFHLLFYLTLSLSVTGTAKTINFFFACPQLLFWSVRLCQGNVHSFSFGPCTDDDVLGKHE